MIDKINFVYRIQYENLISEIDAFCNNINKIHNKTDIKISLIKILRQNYNNTIHIIDIINKEEK